MACFDHRFDRVLRKFLNRIRIRKSRLPIPVRIDGDATGDSRNNSAFGTDWQIVRDFFEQHTQLYEASFWTGAANPRVKDRGKLRERAAV